LAGPAGSAAAPTSPPSTPTAATSPSGSTFSPRWARKATDLWLLNTATRRWQHLPDLPAADIAAKATDLARTGDGRLLVLPTPSPGTNTLAIW
jgi:hypothetical protein